MRQVYLAVAIRGDMYSCFYTEDGMETVDLFFDGVRGIEWETFTDEYDVDDFFCGLTESVRNHLPRFWEEFGEAGSGSPKYEKHWLFSINPGDYYSGFRPENWLEQARELGEVFDEAQALAAYEAATSTSPSADDTEYDDTEARLNRELLPKIAKGLLNIGLQKWPVEGGIRRTEELPPEERLTLFRDAFADIITTPAWGEKSTLRLICEDTYRFMMITTARLADAKAEEVFNTAVKRWEKSDYVLYDTIVEKAKDEIEVWMKQELPNLIPAKLDYHMHWEVGQVQELFQKQPYMPAGESVSILRERVDGPLLAAVLEAYIPVSDSKVCEGKRLVCKHLDWVFRELRRHTDMPEIKWRMVGNPMYRPGLLEDLFAHTLEQEWALTWVDQMYDAVLEELEREENRLIQLIQKL